jgi:excisionase family DNA binding protein
MMPRQQNPNASNPTRSLRGLTGEEDELLTPGEVAAKFRVDPKTVTRWAAAGRLGSIKTPGGHRRFRASEVRALLNGKVEDGSTMGILDADPHDF